MSTHSTTFSEGDKRCLRLWSGALQFSIVWHVCQFSFVNNKSYQLLLAHPELSRPPTQPPASIVRILLFITRVHEFELQCFFEKFGYWVNKPCDLWIKQNWLISSLQHCFSPFYLIVNCRPTMRHQKLLFLFFPASSFSARPLSRFVCEKKVHSSEPRSLKGSFIVLIALSKYFFQFYVCKQTSRLMFIQVLRGLKQCATKKTKSLLFNLSGLEARIEITPRTEISITDWRLLGKIYRMEIRRRSGFNRCDKAEWEQNVCFGGLSE